MVLDAVERQGVDLPSSCRNGSCGTCAQKLLKGQVKYEGEPDLSSLEAGYILTCCATPQGPVIIDA